MSLQANTFEEFGPQRGFSYEMVYLDYTNELRRVDLAANFSGQSFELIIWNLYGQNKFCVENLVNQNCMCNSEHNHMPSNCIPSNFSDSGVITVGQQNCDVWGIQLSETTSYSIITTSDDCYPISEIILDPITGFIVDFYYNVTLGVESDVFVPCSPNVDKFEKLDVPEGLLNTIKKGFRRF